jgi:hypothetical protein
MLNPEDTLGELGSFLLEKFGVFVNKRLLDTDESGNRPGR